MSKRKIIIYTDHFTDTLFDNNKCKLPVGCGGMEKNITSNIEILKDEYNLSVVSFRLEDISKYKENGVHIIPVKLKPVKKVRYLTSLILLINLLKQEPFRIKIEKHESITIIVHNDCVKAVLTKLLKPHFVLVLSIHSKLKYLMWDPDRNIFDRVLCFLIFLISFFLVDTIIMNNKHSLQLLERFKLFRRKLYYLPNSVDTNVFNPDVNLFLKREEMSIDQSTQVLLYVGNAMRGIVKNPTLLFSSFALVKQKIDNLKLIVIGVLDEHGAKILVRKYCNSYSKDITFIKNVKNNDLALYYSTSDLTILTSLSEGTPNVILESLACGTPCVCTNVLDKGIIEDGVNGYIVESFKPEDFAAKILEGLKLSKKLKDKERKALLNPIYDLKNRRENLLKILKV